MIKVNLFAPFEAISCDNLSRSNVSEPNRTWDNNAQSELASTQLLTRSLQQFWYLVEHAPSNPVTIFHTYTARRAVIALLHVVAFVLGCISLALCVRSIIRGFLLWQNTVSFFRSWFSIQLDGHLWNFVHPWFLVIIFNDLLIICGSLWILWTLNGLNHYLDSLSFLFGSSALLVWSGVLRYIGYSYTNSLLMRTIVKSVPALIRFGVCSLILFFAFSLCGWIVLGPYNLKFRTFISTLECLFSLINGDDMFVTFSIIDYRKPWGIFVFSRVFLYVFVTLFIYVVLNLFITIIFEAYEQVKDQRDCRGHPNDSPLFAFIYQPFGGATSGPVDLSCSFVKPENHHPSPSYHDHRSLPNMIYTNTEFEPITETICPLVSGTYSSHSISSPAEGIPQYAEVTRRGSSSDSIVTEHTDIVLSHHLG